MNLGSARVLMINSKYFEAFLPKNVFNPRLSRRSLPCTFRTNLKETHSFDPFSWHFPFTSSKYTDTRFKLDNSACVQITSSRMETCYKIDNSACVHITSSWTETCYKIDKWACVHIILSRMETCYKILLILCIDFDCLHFTRHLVLAEFRVPGLPRKKFLNLGDINLGALMPMSKFLVEEKQCSDTLNVQTDIHLPQVSQVDEHYYRWVEQTNPTS